MQCIADLHLHSRFSRAVSRDMTIPEIACWAHVKGIDLVATGDFTHPLWMKDIQKYLKEDGTGILKLKTEDRRQKTEKTNQSSVVRSPSSPLFLLSTELSCIYSQSGKTRRVHTLVWVPTIASALAISRQLTKRGCNVLSDGRPILGLSLIDLSELILTVEPNALIVPAHIWTPWFSVYGKMGGFETLAEAFGTYEKYIYAVETGLSSSPDMNWQIKELDTRSIVSFSDAHSGQKLGREVTVFELPETTYKNLRCALVLNETVGPPSVVSATSSSTQSLRAREVGRNIVRARRKDINQPHIEFTVEFYPEEGKYHYSGHRACNIRLTPEETTKKGTMCSACGKPLTQGVMQRVAELATRSQTSSVSWRTKSQKDIRWICDEKNIRPPFLMMVPLNEIISEAIGSPVSSPKVKVHYDTLTEHFGGEFFVLLHAKPEEIEKISTPHIADGVTKVRAGTIFIDPGYDGVFGVVKIWKSEKDKDLVDKSKEQLAIF